jgi:hypothetical protein
MITVLTHTRHDRPDLLERCVNSVQAALPLGGRHLIVEKQKYDDWVHSRVHDAKEHDLVAFVDDDDFIPPDALRICLDAIQSTGLGAAVTNEVEVDLSGKTIQRAFGDRAYHHAAIHPRVVHHLCVLRGNLIDERAIELHKRFGVGIDWFIRQSVVQQHGCVQVPIDGYFWTQHQNQHTAETQLKYGQNIGRMCQAIRETWPAKHFGKMPTFVTSSEAVTT